MPKLLNRKEIAALLGISQAYLSKIVKEGRANMPKPVGTGRSGVMYVESEIKAWIAANIDQIISSKLNNQIIRRNLVDELTNTSITPLSFMQGKFASKAAKNKSRFKRLVSSVIRPETVKVVTPYNNYGEYCERLL